jgi:hypothetical protein
LYVAERIEVSVTRSRLLRGHLTADVLRELVPFFAIVRPKWRRLVIAPVGALKGLSNLLIIVYSKRLKAYFVLEALTSQNELSPVHHASC